MANCNLLEPCLLVKIVHRLGDHDPVWVSLMQNGVDRVDGVDRVSTKRNSAVAESTPRRPALQLLANAVRYVIALSYCLPRVRAPGREKLTHDCLAGG